LESDVEGDANVLSLRLLHQLLEIREGSELRVNLRVPSLLRADLSVAADVVPRRLQQVVLALALGRADGMDRRQVKDVEAHRLHFGKKSGDVLQGSERARKQLVPGRIPRVDGSDGRLELPLVHLDAVRVRLSLEGLADLQLDGQVLPALLPLLQVALPGE